MGGGQQREPQYRADRQVNCLHQLSIDVRLKPFENQIVNQFRCARA